MAPTKVKTDPQVVWDEACAIGHRAGTACQPEPMVVQAFKDPLDSASPVVQSWHVPDGPCGFAWITIRPARGSFVRWLREHGLGHNGYRGGWKVPIHGFGQSYYRKMACAKAIAECLQQYGVQAFYDGTLD